MSIKNVMSNAHADEAAARERLSALADGELDAAAVADACAAWKQDPALRSTWHSYQLIGDVLRSRDLASHGERDRAFMASLRSRLAEEPVVLAPEPIVLPLRSDAARRTRWGWAAPSAVAAGFAAVAGVLLVTRVPPADAPVASYAAPAANFVVDASTLLSAPAPTIEARGFTASNNAVIRDPQLDRYLEAHKQFAGSSLLGMPSGYLRNATVEVPGR